MNTNNHEQIATILLETGNAACIQKAKQVGQNTTLTTLHLRSLNLEPNTIREIATILKLNNTIQSISFSYNPLGDLGAISIVNSLPNTIREIGLVGCDIGDKGGLEILRQAKKLPHLEMLCIEQNHFSMQLKQAFQSLKKENPHIVVVF